MNVTINRLNDELKIAEADYNAAVERFKRRQYLPEGDKVCPLAEAMKDAERIVARIKTDIQAAIDEQRAEESRVYAAAQKAFEDKLSDSDLVKAENAIIKAEAQAQKFEAIHAKAREALQPIESEADNAYAAIQAMPDDLAGLLARRDAEAQALGLGQKLKDAQDAINTAAADMGEAERILSEARSHCERVRDALKRKAWDSLAAGDASALGRVLRFGDVVVQQGYGRVTLKAVA